MISQYQCDAQTYANRIFQSFFTIFFLTCTTREKALHGSSVDAESDSQSAAFKASDFTGQQLNQLINASLIMDSSNLFNDFAPLRLYLRDISHPSD